MSKFQEAFESGALIVNAMWWNANAAKAQVSIQFIQRFNRNEMPTEFFTANSGGNPLIGIAVGSGPRTHFDATAIANWSLENLKSRLNISKDFETKLKKSSGEATIKMANTDTVITAKALYGVDVVLYVERSTVRNPKSMKQTPILANLSTGAVMMYQNEPLYQHTKLVPGTTPVFVFSGHSTTFEEFKTQQGFKATGNVDTLIDELASVMSL